MKTITCILLCSFSLALFSCDQHNGSNSSTEVKHELYGTWNNFNGCNAKYMRYKNKLFLVSFDDTKGHSLKNLQLTTKKDGITIKFENLANDFSGTYSEGMMVIDRYCLDPLHKTNKN